MREIKFRGYNKWFKVWVYGDVLNFQEVSNIHYLDDNKESHYFLVDKKSIGQFARLKYDNGKDIYEGDIVNYVTGNPSRYVNCVVEYGEYQTYTQFTDKDGECGDIENHVGFYLNDNGKKIPLASLWIQYVGNIYENPELLK